MYALVTLLMVIFLDYQQGLLVFKGICITCPALARALPSAVRGPAPALAAVPGAPVRRPARAAVLPLSPSAQPADPTPR